MKILLIQGHPDPRGGHFGHALADSYASLKCDIVEFCGIAPVRTSLVGTVETSGRGAREIWLAKMQGLGRAGR